MSLYRDEWIRLPLALNHPIISYGLRIIYGSIRRSSKGELIQC